jgi:hypothetical protein
MILRVFVILFLGLWHGAGPAVGADLITIPLPPLKVDGLAASAHSQGMEIIGGHFFVTARLETSRPKRAILVRTKPPAGEWDVWDITPANPSGASGALDHPGGFQSDGQRLWIPVSESVRRGRTLVRVFALDQLKPGQSARSEFDFPVEDHIGALAVATNHGIILGASWDTETVYVWDLRGRLQRTLSGPELTSRGLGVISSGTNAHAGVAVQDWKIYGDLLYASGLFGDSVQKPLFPRGRLLVFKRFLDAGFEREAIRLPADQPIELAQEAMALSGNLVYLLPENLGQSNRCFRFNRGGR